MPRRRKSNAMKLMEGTYRSDRAHVDADYPPVTDLEPPDWLVGPIAVAEWHARISQLKAAGVITAADLTALGYYCNMHAHVVRKWRVGLEEPSAFYLAQLRMMLNEFGFTPTSRSKPSKACGEGLEKSLRQA